jgi:glutaminyl-tRNA synthetase
MNQNASTPTDFIQEAVAEDLRLGRYQNVRTRLPPEPNGYLHIGHAKAFLIDYNIAREYGGALDLRFDDTNPTKEETEFVEAIQEDARWLGIEWEKVLYSSDFFDLLYEWAVKLVKKGKAYVDDQSPDQVSRNRGTLTEPGVDSPFRERSVEENLDLLERMKRGEFPDGTRVLRAKIDMAHGNMNMRDPIMYRILHEPPHHRTGKKWCIYPMYDWAQGQNDAMHGITHSLCDIAYEDHRPLYDWFLDELEIPNKPRQIEFARLNLTYTILSKRYLRQLVEDGHVSGWDDPRMPSLRGLRRRGYTPEAIRDFIARAGVAKNPTISEVALLEACIREDLNKRAPRRMAVLKPIKLVIDNYPDEKTETIEAINNPEDASAGTRAVPFGKVLYIEQDDFRQEPPKKYYRLYPGNEVRLRYAYLVTCTGFERDPQTGEVTEVHCTYDPATRGGDAPDGRKVKSTIHWVSQAHAIQSEVRLYDRLFIKADINDIGEDEHFIDYLNKDSLEIIQDCFCEASLGEVEAGDIIQFERSGYFCVDPDSQPGAPVFNRTVTLRDTWAKIERSLS